MRSYRLMAIGLAVGAMVAATPGRANPLDDIKKQIEKTKQQQQQQHQKQQQQQQQQHQAQQQGAAPAGEPLQAKIKEEPMGPAFARLVLSEDGNHIAIVVPKGSRQAVMVDGVEGPTFDEIPQMFANSQGTMALSPSGGRSAYIGRRGGDYVAVVDGKEALTVGTNTAVNALHFVVAQTWGFKFNHDGSRLAYPALDGDKWVMVVDGTKSPAYKQLDLSQVALAGKRLIYVAMTDDGKWHAVVDSKPGPAYDVISTLTMTDDGAHYVYFAASGNAQFAVHDGTEGAHFHGRIGDLEMAPDGRIAYMAQMPSTPNNPHQGPALIVEGLTVANATTFNVPDVYGAAPLHRVAWSADHKRFAYVEVNAPNPGDTVKVNGKPMGLTYNGIGQVFFSPDGSRLHYMATSNTGTFPVVDGKELEGCRTYSDFAFSRDGQHYAYFARTQDGGKIYLDGKEFWKSNDLYQHSLAFSADGKRLAFGPLASVSVFQPLVDGKAESSNLGAFSPRIRTTPPIFFPPIVFSADGSHVVYVASKPGTKISVVVDGTWYPGATGQFSFPSFSPDNKRFAVMNWNAKGWAVMVGGKVSPVYDDMLELSVGGCRFIDNDEFRFYGIKNKQIYRVTVGLAG